MGEIKKEPVTLTDGQEYTSVGKSFVIDEDHTVADIVRFAISQAGGEDGGKEEVVRLVSEGP